MVYVGWTAAASRLGSGIPPPFPGLIMVEKPAKAYRTGRRQPAQKDRTPDPGSMALLALVTAAVLGHSSLLIPPARNAIDRTLPPWKGGGSKT